MPEIVTDSWEHNAERWIKIIREGLDPLRELVTDKAMLNAIGHCSGKKTLDAGCGEGYLSRAMAGIGAVVTGIDRSKKLIAAAKEHEQLQPLGITYIVGDFRETGLSDNSFDLIICNHSIYEIPEPAIAFKEFSRLLVPQGRLIMLILHPCFYDLRTQETAHTDFKSYFVSRRMSKQLEIGGIKLMKAVTIYLHPLEYYANALKTAGFVISDIKEPRPSQELRRSNPWLRENFNIPIFLLIEAARQAT